MAGSKDSGAAGDPFAPWRGVSEFTIQEAAHLCAGIVPGRAFRFWKDRDKAEQEEVAALAGWHKRIVGSVQDIGITAKYVPERTNYSTNVDGVWHTRSTTPAHTEYGKVTRAALVEWLDKHGARPAFFVESVGVGAARAAELGDTERETLLALVGVLAELAGLDMSEVRKGHAFANRLAPEMKKRGCERDRKTIANKLLQSRAVIKPSGEGWTQPIPIGTT